MHKNGFTLIEILVSVSILLILTILGITNMLDFNDRQQIIQAEEMVAEAVYRAQSLARSGKMDECTALDGYEIEFLTGEINIRAVCSVGPITTIETIALPDQVFFESSVTVMVQAENGILDVDLDRRTQPIESYTLILTGNYKNDYEFTLSKEGELGTGTWSP